MRKLLGQDGDVIAIDGNTVCGAEKYSKTKRTLHIVTAYMTANGVTLAQADVPDNYETKEKNGGRIEIRKCYVSADDLWFTERNPNILDSSKKKE